MQKVLQTLFQPGDVAEVRMLNTPKGTVSGYFNEWDKLQAAVQRYDGKANIYFTLNPVNPALLARANNRLVERPKSTTTDADIVSRRWLLVDIDPVRPSGIMADDAEKAAAKVKIKEVFAFLKGRGWPDPVACDSGSGYHLLYKLDLSNSQESRDMISSCLKALSLRFDDGIVSVDISVFNAGRIVRLYGTVNCKGENLPERPHRRSGVIKTPSEIKTVTFEQLEALAGLLPKPQQPERREYGGAFDLPRWIDDHGLPVKFSAPWNGGTKWILDPCPWNSDHQGGSAHIVQLPGGAIGAGCKHNGCQGKGWHELRDHVEPGWRGSKVKQLPRQEDKQTAVAQAEEWEKPLQFNEYDLPPFRYDVFPDWLSRFILAESECSQTPPDLTGMLVLAVCAAGVAKKVNVKVRGGWTEPLNISTVTALSVASRKSAVFADVLEPVVEHEEELMKDMLPFITDKATQRKILEQTLTRVQGEAAKATGVKRGELTLEAQALARELVEMQVKALPRLVVDDCSPEKLAGIMSDQGGKIGVFAPEGDVFDIMGGRYSSGTPNLGVYLRGHAGDTIRIDRVGRPPEFIKNPALTFGLCVQPEVLQGLIHKPTFRGRGLLGRFLYSLPKPNIGSRRIGSVSMPAEIMLTYKQNVKKLFSLPGQMDQQGELIPYSLTLSADAQLTLNEFEQWIEPQLGELGTLGNIQDWAGKLAGAVVRIAGILHMAGNVDRPEPWGEPIQEQSISGAVVLAEYLISHARAAYDEMGGNEDFDAAKHILKWIKKGGLPQFTKRDAHYNLQGRFKKADELDPALMVLTERGFIREVVVKKEGPGRKSSPVYEVNPAVF